MSRRYIARLTLEQLLRVDERRGARAIVAQVRRSGGSITAAAEASGVHHATFKRWIARYGVRDLVEQIRKQRGLPPAQTPARAVGL